MMRLVAALLLLAGVAAAQKGNHHPDGHRRRRGVMGNRFPLPVGGGENAGASDVPVEPPTKIGRWLDVWTDVCVSGLLLGMAVKGVMHFKNANKPEDETWHTKFLSVPLLRGPTAPATRAPVFATAVPRQAHRVVISAAAVGDNVADFTAVDQHGMQRRLSDWTSAGQSVVLWFYGKANTSGWQTEGDRFQHLLPRYAAANAAVVGVSVDAIALNKQFSDDNNFTYPLLCDTEGAVVELFGAWKGTKAARATFVISPDNRIVYHEPNFDKATGPDDLITLIESGQLGTP